MVGPRFPGDVAWLGLATVTDQPIVHDISAWSSPEAREDPGARPACTATGSSP